MIFDNHCVPVQIHHGIKSTKPLVAILVCDRKVIAICFKDDLKPTGRKWKGRGYGGS